MTYGITIAVVIAVGWGFRSFMKWRRRDFMLRPSESTMREQALQLDAAVEARYPAEFEAMRREGEA